MEVNGATLILCVVPAEPCAPRHGRRRQERSAHVGREPEPGMLDYENTTARPVFLVICV